MMLINSSGAKPVADNSTNPLREVSMVTSHARAYHLFDSAAGFGQVTPTSAS